MKLTRDIILLGPQGCGKGTQAARLEDAFNTRYYEMGQALRDEIASQSDLGHMIAPIVKHGMLVPPEITFGLISTFIDKTGHNTPIIIDGMPRSVEQREPLDALLRGYNRDFIVIYLDLDDDNCRLRLAKRVEETIAKGLIPRADDIDNEKINTRLMNFHTRTIPVLEAYKNEGKLIKIDAKPDIDTVFNSIIKALQEHGIVI